MRSTLPALACSIALAVLGAVSTADAQTIPSAYEYIEFKSEAGPFVGVRSVSTGRFGFGPSGGLLTGGRWGIELAGPMSFEGVAGYMIGERDIVSPGRAEGDRVIGQADVRMATIDARLKVTFTGARTWHRIAPFMVFGGGLAFDMAGLDPIEEEQLDPADQYEFGTSFFGTLGFGTRWFITDKFGLRTDGVFSLWRLGTPPGFSDPDRGFTLVEESQWARGLSLTVSGLWRW